MKAEFRELDAEDRSIGVKLKADVIGDDGVRVAIVSHLDGRYICSCWEANGMVAIPKACEHIACVEAAVREATP